MLELVDINEQCNKVLSCIGTEDSRVEYNKDFTIDSMMSLTKIIKSNPLNAYLLGSNTMEQMQVNQWISFSFNIQNNENMTILDNFLYVKSFLVGNRLTLADYFVYLSISDSLQKSSSNVCFHSINRWYSHIHSLIRNIDNKKVTLPTLLSKSTISSTLIEFPNFEVINTTSNILINSAEVLAVLPPVSQEKKQSIVDIEKDMDANQLLDPTKLDIRCGLVVKCWNHPDSDKLLCEEVDLGESAGGVRTIASGIRQYYTAEQLQGRKVLVLANLKERSMAGFKSQGMVLCAVSKDHSQVCLLDVSENTVIGERVLFPGFPDNSIPATPSQMVKKKILEGLAPKLRTDVHGIAHWDESPFTIGNGTVNSSPAIFDGVVS